MKAISVLVIHGPTASGKSTAALELAQQFNAEIINGDSMQVYGHLEILTARPTVADCAQVPHHLYGVLHGNDRGSLGWWYEQACKTIDAIHAQGKLPLVVGGTGLYLRALSQGISRIPDISDQTREAVRALGGESDLYDRVLRCDPQIAGVLRPQDSQRLLRAMEVMMETGKSIYQWQKENHKIATYNIHALAIIPDRSVLYQRINERLLVMSKTGAVEEVKELLSQGIRADSPIMKAVGIREFMQFIQGHISIEQAIEKAQQTTRNYAKRQLTWLRHQPDLCQIFQSNQDIFAPQALAVITDALKVSI